MSSAAAATAGALVERSMLQLSDVHTYIGESHILQGVSFAVAAGRVTVLLGRNGAGKTTTLRTILGLLPARTGTMTFDGVALGGRRPHEIVRHGIGYVPEDRDVFAGLTVAENLTLARRPGAAVARLAHVHQLFPELERRAGQRAGSLSGGQQQMVAIARALVNDNRLLLIDEPSKGLAPVVVTHMTEALAAIKGATTILLVEQNLGVAQALGDDAVILDDGQVVFSGSMAEVASDEALQARYLGAGAHQ
ncbi:MAG: ABC transporter ATP-binding protein [Chloroflexota bacterium]|nr:ABC transporter ATP-binding protein [Chloroflexota bacterium]